MNDGIEIIKYMSSSQSRVRILNKLDSTEADLRELVRKPDIPRSTLQRNLNTLVQRSWIKETEHGYKITPTGRLLIQEFTETAEKVETIDQISSFLQNITSWDTIDLGAFDNPEVSVPEPDKPYCLVNELLERLKSSSEIHGFLSIMSPFLYSHLQSIHDTNDYSGSYIVSTEAIDIQNYSNFEDINEYLQSLGNGQLEVLGYEDQLPFSLFILDNEEVIFTANDEFGRIEVLIRETGIELVQWGKATYEEYRRRSTGPL